MTSVRPGDVLAGKYRVERVLGAGGMGYVVAARHLQLDQLVAMKFLRAGALDETEAVARFLREAKSSVRLRNEHVARVFDVGTLESGEPYIVMEHLEGCDLSALAKQRGAIDVAEASEYVTQACEALAEAHSLGIVHRDVKLANLFVTRGPTGAPLVKVLDFGISKSNPFGESEHEMTRTTSMLGSPRFMSPEQMRDPRAVDARSDIWSLGVVLYRLVAGRPPFEGETLGRLLTMVMHEQPTPLSEVRADLPPGFEQVVMRCMEKEPSARFANVAELAYALLPFAADPARARAAADRIAAMLSVTPAPSSLDVSRLSGRPSGPPGASDTGTASPWAGTQSGRRDGHRSTLLGVAIGLAGVLLAGGVALRMTRGAAPAPTPIAAEAPKPPVDPTPAPIVPDVAPPVAVAAPPVTVIAPPPAVTTEAPKPGVKHARDDRRRAPSTAPARRTTRPSSPTTGPQDDGIPSTRD